MYGGRRGKERGRVFALLDKVVCGEVTMELDFTTVRASGQSELTSSA